MGPQPVRRVIAVVMGGKSAARRDMHTAALLDRSFKKAVAAPIITANGDRFEMQFGQGDANVIIIPKPPAKPTIAVIQAPQQPQSGSFTTWIAGALAA